MTSIFGGSSGHENWRSLLPAPPGDHRPWDLGISSFCRDQGSGRTRFIGSGSKIGHAFGIKDQKFAYKNGISDEKPRYHGNRRFLNGVDSPVRLNFSLYFSKSLTNRLPVGRGDYNTNDSSRFVQLLYHPRSPSHCVFLSAPQIDFLFISLVDNNTDDSSRIESIRPAFLPPWFPFLCFFFSSVSQIDFLLVGSPRTQTSRVESRRFVHLLYPPYCFLALFAL